MNTRPQLRQELTFLLRQALAEELSFVDGCTKNCLNCCSFEEKTEICRRFNQRPPARVIALACAHHEDVIDAPF